MDINGETKTITLEAKYYSPEELLNVLNEKLEQVSANIVASYYEGRLKLSFTGVGVNTIDSIHGNAKGTLFFKLSKIKSKKFNKFYYTQGWNIWRGVYWFKSSKGKRFQHQRVNFFISLFNHHTSLPIHTIFWIPLRLYNWKNDTLIAKATKFIFS